MIALSPITLIGGGFALLALGVIVGCTLALAHAAHQQAEMAKRLGVEP